MRIRARYTTRKTHQESTDEWNDSTIRVQAIGDSTHSMLTDTVSDVRSRVVTKFRAGRLEVNAALDLGQVTSSKISRTANKLGQDSADRGQDGLGQCTGGLGGIGGLIYREGGLPVLWELASNSAGELGVLLGILIAVGFEERIPLRLGVSTFLGDLVVGVVCLLRNDELLRGVEAELGLECFDVVGLESYSRVR